MSSWLIFVKICISDSLNCFLFILSILLNIFLYTEITRLALTFLILIISMYMFRYFYLEPALNLLCYPSVSLALYFFFFFVVPMFLLFFIFFPYLGKVCITLVLIGKVRELTLNSTSCSLAPFRDSVFKSVKEWKVDVHSFQSNYSFLAVLHILALLYFD